LCRAEQPGEDDQLRSVIIRHDVAAQDVHGHKSGAGRAPEPIPLFLFSEAREKFGEPLASAPAGDGLDDRSGSGHHACSVRGQVERKMTPGEGLFSLRLPKFESYQPGMFNSPAIMPFGLAPPQCQAKSLPQLHVGNAAAPTRTVSAAPFRPNRQKFPGKTRGF
jgi:hypothetical protein